MADSQLIAYLKLLHAGYNLTVMIFFICQSMLGFQIRRGRLAGSPPFRLIKRHRRNGLLLTFMGVFGFLSGMILAGIDSGELFKHFYHFLAGILLVSLIITTFVVSRRIKGLSSDWRNMHLGIGLLIIFFYVVQIILGLDVLL